MISVCFESFKTVQTTVVLALQGSFTCIRSDLKVSNLFEVLVVQYYKIVIDEFNVFRNLQICSSNH